MSDFDSRARDWDKEKMHLDRSQAIASELLKAIPVKAGMRVLEYGAGTGLLSFLFKDKFSEITMMDSSREMVNVTQEKIQAAAVKNMKALFIDLEKEDFKGEFDIIYSQMALHHVCNIDSILGKFHSMLSKGGYLAIADLYKEDGSFHGDMTVPHNGFDMEEISSMLEKHGFINITHRQCYILKKSIASGELRDFPIFLMTATR
jgi:ubiquinone/menaquinone biosynthesis C-methylase UbiE